jgi:hypothetical protein
MLQGSSLMHLSLFQYLHAEGSWSVPEGTDGYSMTIQRTYSTGKQGTDVGEFNFDLTKTYKGKKIK